MKDFFTTILYVPLYNVLMLFVWLSPGNYLWVAIVVLTLLIRFILLPTSLKAARAQVKLQALQPEMNRIRKEIKDQQAQGRALMDLYKREGASPFGSCLPLLIQLPILIILYQVFRGGFTTENFHLLYSFLPHPQAININFFGIDLSKPELWILPITAGLSQFVLSKMMMLPTPKATDGKKTEPDAMQMANKQMVYLFPIMTIFIGRSIPAALSLYWVVTTVFGIVQQYYVNKTVKKTASFKTEIALEEKIVDKEIDEITEGKRKRIDKKKDLMTRIVNKRLDKQEKKAGVEVTIRKKQ